MVRARQRPDLNIMESAWDSEDSLNPQNSRKFFSNCILVERVTDHMPVKPVKWEFCKRYRGKKLKFTLCAKMLKFSSVRFSDGVGIFTLAAMYRFTASFLLWQ